MPVKYASIFFEITKLDGLGAIKYNSLNDPVKRTAKAVGHGITGFNYIRANPGAI